MKKKKLKIVTFNDQVEQGASLQTSALSRWWAGPPVTGSKAEKSPACEDSVGTGASLYTSFRL
jgi:hypothetical protein